MANNLLNKAENQAIQVIRLGERLNLINSNIKSYDRYVIDLNYANQKRDKLQINVNNFSKRIIDKKLAIG